MPPPGAPAPTGDFSSGLSTMTASVVRNRPTIEAAFCSADRVTFTASMTPALNMSSYYAGGGIEALVDREVAHFFDHDATLEAGVDRDLLQRLLDGPGHDTSADGLVTLELFGLVQHSRLRPKQRDATAGDDTLFDGGLGRRHGVLDTVLLFLQLDLGGGTDLDDGHATGQLGQPLLQLLTVVVRVGVLDLGLDLADPALDVGLAAGTFDDGRLVLGDDDLAGLAQQVEGGVLELQADLFRRSPGRRSGWPCPGASPCGARRTQVPLPPRS